MFKGRDMKIKGSSIFLKLPWLIKKDFEAQKGFKYSEFAWNFRG